MKQILHFSELFKAMYEDFLYWFGVFTVGVILSVNIPFLWVLRKISSPTLINKLIGLDCIIGRTAIKTMADNVQRGALNYGSARGHSFFKTHTKLQLSTTWVEVKHITHSKPTPPNLATPT